VKSPFEGDLVRLRAREASDAEANFRWMNDPEVMRFIQVRYPQSMRSQRMYLEGLAGPNFEASRFSIETLADRTAIGTCHLRETSPEDRSADLGITIGDKAYHNGGYGTDAMRVLCRLGFDVMNLQRIELGVFAENARARHVYEKLGFQVEACLRDSDFRASKYRDLIIMGLLRGELR
jgi:RimJ/RimL family protein N-acetyltransferase